MSCATLDGISASDYYNDDDAADDDNDDYELRLETSRGIRKCGLLRFLFTFFKNKKNKSLARTTRGLSSRYYHRHCFETF